MPATLTASAQFLVIQGGDYIVNLNQIAGIDCSDPDSWEVCLSSGQEYTFEDEDLAALKAHLGL